MCQLRSEGGRRCPVHLNSTRVIISHLRAGTAISIRQAHAIFSELRSTPDSATQPSEADWEGVGLIYPDIQTELADMDAPDARTILTYGRLPDKIRAFEVSRDAFIDTIADSQGRDPVAVSSEYNRLLTKYERTPGALATANLSSAEAVAYAERYGAIAHPATLATMKELIAGVEVTTSEQGDTIDVRLDTNGRYESLSYNSETEVLAVKASGASRESYYHSVSPQQYGELVTADRVDVTAGIEGIVGNPAHMFASAAEAESARTLHRCRSCGQFTAAAHECPQSVLVATGLVTEGWFDTLSAAQQDAVIENMRTMDPATAISTATLESSAGGVVDSEPGRELNSVSSEGFLPATGVTDQHMSNVATFLANLDNNQFSHYDGFVDPSSYGNSIPSSLLSAIEGVYEGQDDATSLPGGAIVNAPRVVHTLGLGFGDNYPMQDVSPGGLPRGYRINTTVKSKFGAYLNGTDTIPVGATTPITFSNQQEAQEAFDAPDSTSRQFVHMLSPSGERVFIGTVPRGCAVKITGRILPVLNVQRRLAPRPGIEPITRAQREQEIQEYEGSPANTLLEDAKLRQGDPSHHHHELSRRNGYSAPISALGVPLAIKIPQIDHAVTAVRAGGDAYIEGSVDFNDHHTAGTTLIADRSGTDLSLPVGSPSGQVTFHGRMSATQEDGLSIDFARSLKCSCADYVNNYRCAHTRFVEDTLPYVIETGATDELFGRNASTTHNAFKSNDSTVNLEKFLASEGSQKFSTALTDTGAVHASFRRDTFERDAKPIHLSRRTCDEILNNNSLTLEEKVRYIKDAQATRHQTGKWADSARHLLKQDRASVTFTPPVVHVTGTTGSVNDATFVRSDGEVKPVYSVTRCVCGRFIGDNPCEHEDKVKTALDAYAKYLGGDETDLIDFSDPDGDIPTALREIQNEVRRERRINQYVEEFGSTRLEAEAEVDNPESKYGMSRAELAAEEMENRAIAHPTLSEWREFYSNPDNRTEEIPETLDPDRIARIVAHQARRDELWQSQDEETSAEEAVSAFVAPYSRFSQPNLQGGVTDGLCDPSAPSPMGFGIELEFSFDEYGDYEGDDDSDDDYDDDDYDYDYDNEGRYRNRLEAIVSDLRDAGLTSQYGVNSYGTGGETGWDGFSLEYDESVDGELVTPILYDTPEDWARLNTAIEIIKSHGGSVDERCGSHVNISSHNLAGSLSKHTELIRTFSDHSEDAYALAGDPARGTHRGTYYCTPNTDSPAADVALGDRNPRELGARGRAVNLSRSLLGSGAHIDAINISNSMNNDDSSRIEFRIWDGTLDIGAIQTQVAVSAALVDRVDRRVREVGFSPSRVAPLTGEDAPVGGLEGITKLANELFRKKEDRAKMINLYAQSDNAYNGDREEN